MIKPLRNYLAVRRDLKPDMSDGGIYIGRPVDTGLVKEPVSGEVLAVGPGDWDVTNTRRESMWGIKPGDRIYFSPVGSVDFEQEGETLTMIRRDAVMGNA